MSWWRIWAGKGEKDLQMALRFYVCESANFGFKVVASSAEYGDLHPCNMTIIRDGLTRERAVAIVRELER